jgi:EmrB/QacA subfamily drug resistance transporter
VITTRARPCETEAIRAARGATCTVRQQRWVLAATILASTIAYVDESVVNVALPAIGRDLSASPAALQWVINAYTLCLAAFLLVGGAAGDRLGRRGVFIAGVTLFGLASLGCGFSREIAQLIAARAVQGAGAALLIPCSLAIIGAAFAENERGRAIGTWAGFSAIAAAIGPLLGGWIVDHLAWQTIFFINPVLCLAALWIAWRQLPESTDPDAPPGIDWLGALLAFGGLAGVAFGLIALPDTGWRDPTTAATLAGGIVLLAIFVWHEGRTPAPMMPLGLFRSATFSGVNALTLLLYGALGGAFFLLPFALISVHGYSATMAGAVFLPFTAIMAGLSRWSGGLLDRVGTRLPLVAGPVIVAVGFVLLALAGPQTSLCDGFPAAGLRRRSRHGGDGGAAHDHGHRRRSRPSDRRGLGHQQRRVLGGEPLCHRRLRRAGAARFVGRRHSPGHAGGGSPRPRRRRLRGRDYSRSRRTRSMKPRVAAERSSARQARLSGTFRAGRPFSGR